jgi:predicted nucleotidyltransferase
MVDDAILKIIRKYLAALPAVGIHPSRAILFGSFARGDAGEWSDIDLVVVAPEFDDEYDCTVAQKLWGATGSADDRIEPVPCGETEWETDGRRPLLTIARREGIEITA